MNHDILTTLSMDKSVAGRIELAQSINEAYNCGALWELKQFDVAKLNKLIDELQRKTFQTHVDDALITIFKKELSLRQTPVN